jgi:ferredoxin-type protein NapH
MQPERMPLSKFFDVPFLSLDGTSVEMASLLFLFLVVVIVTSIRRHRQLLRRLVQVASVVFFFFVVYSCLGVFGMIRNSLYGVTLIGSAYSESFYWMALPVLVLATALVAGPVFCGWICPTGALQDLSGWLHQRVLRGPRLRFTRAQLAGLGVLMVLFLSAVIWIGVKKQLFIEDSSLHWAASLLLLCYLVIAGAIDDLPTRQLRLLSLGAIFLSAVSHMIITSPVHFAFTSRSDPSSALSTVVILVAALFVPRAWCRYLCPWGCFTGFLHRFSRVRIVRDKSLCTDCGACDSVCDVGAIEGGRVRTEHCQFCYSCVDSCSSGAFRVVDVWKLGTSAAPASVETARAEVTTS